MATSTESWQIADINEIPPVKPDWPATWKSVRHHFGITAFGVNAVTKDEGNVLIPVMAHSLAREIVLAVMLAAMRVVQVSVYQLDHFLVGLPLSALCALEELTISLISSHRAAPSRPRALLPLGGFRASSRSAGARLPSRKEAPTHGPEVLAGLRRGYRSCG